MEISNHLKKSLGYFSNPRHSLCFLFARCSISSLSHSSFSKNPASLKGFAKPICNASLIPSLSRPLHSLISWSGFYSETNPSSKSSTFGDYHGYRNLSTFGSSSVCPATYSESSKPVVFNLLNGRYNGYTNPILDLHWFETCIHGCFRFYSVSSCDVSQHGKMDFGDLRPIPTPEQVAEILNLIRRDEYELETKLDSLNERIPIAIATEVILHLNCQKVSALRFFNWIRSRMPDLEGSTDICSLVIDNCGLLNDYDAMRCLLDDFGQNQFLLTRKAFGFLSMIASEALTMKSIERVVVMLREVGGSCYASRVQSLVEMFTLLGSSKLANFVTKIAEKKIFSFVLLRVMCRRCDFKGARDMLDEMSKAGCDPNARVYNYLISSLCKNGKIDDACEVFQEMQDKNCPPDALTFEIFIYNFCRQSKFHIAHQFLDDMVTRGLEPRFVTHAAFIKGFFKLQQYSEAYEYVLGSCDKFKCSSNRNYSLLASLHEKKGNLVVSQNILSEMIKKGLRPHHNLYKRVLKHLLKSGKEELASDLQKQFLQLEVKS